MQRDGKLVLCKINNLVTSRARSSDLDSGPTSLDEFPSKFRDERMARPLRLYSIEDFVYDLHISC